MKKLLFIAIVLMGFTEYGFLVNKKYTGSNKKDLR
jgi:hypothetical protein